MALTYRSKNARRHNQRTVSNHTGLVRLARPQGRTEREAHSCSGLVVNEISIDSTGNAQHAFHE